VTCRQRILSLLPLLSCIWLVSGCHRERPTEVRVEGGVTPVFNLSGNGDLSSFSVYLVSPSDFEIGRTVDSLSDDSFFTEPPVWSIEAQPDWLHGRRVEDISRLTYGVVPPGYKQRIPANGSAPPAIISGRKYFFHCDTTNAPTAAGGFQVAAGKVVPLKLGLPCIGGSNGKNVTVPCIDHP